MVKDAAGQVGDFAKEKAELVKEKISHMKAPKQVEVEIEVETDDAEADDKED